MFWPIEGEEEKNNLVGAGGVWPVQRGEAWPPVGEKYQGGGGGGCLLERRKILSF